MDVLSTSYSAVSSTMIISQRVLAVFMGNKVIKEDDDSVLPAFCWPARHLPANDSFVLCYPWQCPCKEELFCFCMFVLASVYFIRTTGVFLFLSIVPRPSQPLSSS